MDQIEARLQECLEAFREGRWDLDECLRRYPEHADELRPLLETALAAAEAFAVQPSPEWAASARERFLVATGQRLQDALDVEPAPSFVAAARIRFLLSAQRLRGERAQRPQPRRLPLFGSTFRALATGLAGVAIFLGFSTYTVATADAALPGDWQYPVKLQTERVRLALAFGAEAEREIKLDIAAERVAEIEELTARGKIIGPGVLDRLVEQTEPLIEDAEEGGWDADEAARLKEVSAKQAEVLVQAEPNVAPAAQEQLAAAIDVSNDGQAVAQKLLLSDPERPPTVIEPSVQLSPTPDPEGSPPVLVPVTITPEAGTPAAEPTATPSDAPSPEPTPDGVAIGDEAVVARNSIDLYPLSAGRLRALVPGTESGWYMLSEPGDGLPPLVRLTNHEGAVLPEIDGASLIVMNPRNGDMYWYIFHNGRTDEVQMRLRKDGRTLIADENLLRATYGDAAEIPLYVLESIEIVAAPTPTPEPTETPAAEPTSTPPPATPGP
jgi:hypothetical protein